MDRKKAIYLSRWFFNPSAKELLYLSILFRATFIASTDFSAFFMFSAITLFSLPVATSCFNLSSTSPFSISAIFLRYCSYTLLENSTSCSSLRKISLTEVSNFADCIIVFFLPKSPAEATAPPTPAPTPIPRAAPPPTIVIVPPSIPSAMQLSVL